MIWLILPLVIVGCATTQKGLVTDKGLTKQMTNYMAYDAAKEVSELLPAAQTELSIKSIDQYGKAFTYGLRRSGFAISEQNQYGSHIIYFVDKLFDGIYRSSIAIDGITLSRAYSGIDKPYPICGWSVGGVR